MTHIHPRPRAIVRSGLIVAEMTIVKGGVKFHGPLTFDGETVAENGTWFHSVDATNGNAVADALCNTYLDLHDDWCDRKAFNITPKPQRRHLATSLGGRA